MKNLRTFDQFVNESKVERENINEAFEWWQPLLAIGASVGLVAGTFYAILAPSAIVGGPFMGPEGWGDVVRYYKKKFKDKQAAKRLTKEDVLELINLIQTNIDGLPKGERNYMKSLINRLEAEINKDKEELDKDNLLVLLRDVKKYAKRKGVNVSDATITNESINESMDLMSSLEDMVEKSGNTILDSQLNFQKFDKEIFFDFEANGIQYRVHKDKEDFVSITNMDTNETGRLEKTDDLIPYIN